MLILRTHERKTEMLQVEDAGGGLEQSRTLLNHTREEDKKRSVVLSWARHSLKTA